INWFGDGDRRDQLGKVGIAGRTYQQSIGIAAAFALAVVTGFLAEGAKPGAMPLAETESGSLVVIVFQFLLGL
ncbi:MAG: hypothetical protein ACK56I_07515, partial [bacterium]